MNKRCTWTKQEDDILRVRYPLEGNSILLRSDLNKSENAIQFRARTLKLKTTARLKGYGRIYGSYIYDVRRNAKTRNLPAPLLDGSLENTKYLDSLITEKCPLSGKTLTCKTHRFDSMATISLDRIDSSLGYIKGNVRWVHKDINIMKWNMSDEEFLGFVFDIAKTYNL